ncbi:MAG: metal ABC transporter substrate-binding protein [Chitinispirillales bacterium]|nr:metal ABC transporter substrate-binding protein [Chitinispirillales bacterium]
MIFSHKNLLIKCLLPAALLLLVLTIYCGKNSGEVSGNEKIVLTSFYPMYIAALNVTENIPGIRLVNMAAPAAGCLHDYQLTAADGALLEKAAVLIVNGGGMESFLEKAVSLNKNLIVIDASENVEFIRSSTDNHHNHNHSHSHSHGNDDDDDIDDDAQVNSHVWLSIQNYIHQVETITKYLSAWDSVNSAGYVKNAQNFIAELHEFKKESDEKMASVSDKKIAIFHEGFAYLAWEFGLTVAAVIEREPGVEPSASEIISTVRTIKKTGVKALFTEPQYTSAAAKTISAETGLPLFTLDPVVSGSMTNDSYITAMRKNIETLKRALE